MRHAGPEKPSSLLSRIIALLVLTAIVAIVVAIVANPSHVSVFGQMTRTTYVSNLGQTDAGAPVTWSSQNEMAIGFTTGTISNPSAATSGLSAVTIRMRNQLSTPLSAATVKLFSSAGGGAYPDSELATFTEPSSPSTGTHNFTFTAASPYVLQGGTTYFIVITPVATSIVTQPTLGDNEDSGGLSGWSIANNDIWRSKVNAWSAAQNNPGTTKIRLQGPLGDAPTATPTATATATPTPTAQAQTLTDRQILEAFYDATDGPNWTTSTSWKTTAALNDWFGVTADGSDNVSGLNLAGNNLTGSIPSSLGGLSSLTELFLAQNMLTGEIPSELGGLTNLTQLDFQQNQFTGEIPPELGGLSSLTHLNLDRNQLEGEIPSQLGNLTNLNILILPLNQLTGEIPPELGGLSNLTQLNLNSNQLSGEIPSELGGLSSLTDLSLYTNQLTGEIPSDLGNLTNLTHMRLDGNRLTGEIPTELGSLVSLNNLYLNGNQLTGAIPSELAALINLRILWLQNNQLTGSIPSWLGPFTSLSQLILSNNKFTGEIPSELGSLTNLAYLYLNDNQLTAAIPSELDSLTNLIFLYLYGNHLTGSIPSELGNLSNLQRLYLQDNQLTGSIPSDLGNLSNLIHLRLQDNHLTGQIPDLSQLTSLQSLYLHDNRLTGNVPNLNNASNLVALGLGGNDLELDWSMFGSSGNVNLETGRNLFILYLHGSGLEGPIPDWIGANHTNLIQLWLQFNGLTGDVPANFSNLTNLTDLRLHGNTLTGFDALDQLDGLTTLLLPVPADSGGGISIRTEGKSIYLGLQSTSLPTGSDLTSTRITLDGSPSISPGVIGSSPHPEVIEDSAVDIVLNFRNAAGARVGTPSAPITVCVAAPVGSAGADERLVLLKYDEDDGWTALPSADPPSGYAPGAGNVAVCGSTDSFSVFVPAVFVPSDLEPTPVPGRSAIARIVRLEPSIRSATVSGGDVVRLSFDIYGRQSILDNGLGEELDFEWDDGNAGGSFETTDRPNSIVYTAPEIPGTYTVTADSPHDACLSGEDSEDRCIARFTIKVRRPSAATVERPAPKNPVGEVSSVLADAEGRQYQVFTPEEGGFFDGGDATISAEPGVVPNLEIVGLRISEAGAASNEGKIHHRYTLAGHWYAVTAVDGSGLRISSYELNGSLEVCVPLPAELRSNIADLALVAVNADDSLTILSSRVRIAATGAKVCGHLSAVPATLAVGTPGAPSPLPTADPGTSELPDTGAPTFSSLPAVLWVALVGSSMLLIAFGTLRRSRRETGRAKK